MKVFFICHGNVGRSQMAEALFSNLSPGNHVANSAGVHVHGNAGILIGKLTSANNVLHVMDELGLDLRQKQRKQLTGEQIETYDFIVSMVPKADMEAFLTPSISIRYWGIVDPFEQSLEFTRKTRDDILYLVKELLIELGSSA